MREPVRDKTRLEHILSAIERLEKHAGSLSREELEADVLRYYGIVKLLNEQGIDHACSKGKSENGDE